MNEQQVGRLALRVEGNWWVAYYAMPNTMEDAVELGRIAMVIVRDDYRKRMFMDLMKNFIGDLLAAKTGGEVIWPSPPIPAPESERSGNA